MYIYMYIYVYVYVYIYIVHNLIGPKSYTREPYSPCAFEPLRFFTWSLVPATGGGSIRASILRIGCREILMSII